MLPVTAVTPSAHLQEDGLPHAELRSRVQSARHCNALLACQTKASQHGAAGIPSGFQLCQEVSGGVWSRTGVAEGCESEVLNAVICL